MVLFNVYDGFVIEFVTFCPSDVIRYTNRGFLNIRGSNRILKT